MGVAQPVRFNSKILPDPFKTLVNSLSKRSLYAGKALLSQTFPFNHIKHMFFIIYIIYYIYSNRKPLL